MFTKKDLVKKFMGAFDTNKKAATLYIDYLFETIAEEVLSGKTAVFKKFGTFKVFEYEQDVFNIQTKQRNRKRLKKVAFKKGVLFK